MWEVRFDAMLFRKCAIGIGAMILPPTCNHRRMTVAVCFKCGSFKFGAFNPCPDCGALPENDDDRAVSFALTDHFGNRQELEVIAKQIAGGIRPSLPEDFRKSIATAMRGAEEMIAQRAKQVEEK